MSSAVQTEMLTSLSSTVMASEWVYEPRPNSTKARLEANGLKRQNYYTLGLTHLMRPTAFYSGWLGVRGKVGVFIPEGAT
jgi:hypothetical protein